MWPYTRLLFSEYYLPTQTMLIALCTLFAITVAIHQFRHFLSPLKILFLAFLTCLGGLIGGRLFHVIWEKPEYFLSHPEEIFTRFDGMTFYGSLLLGFLTVYGLSRLWVSNRRHRDQILSLSFVLAAFGYGVLRVGCFAMGCCWGKLCYFPWAVTYRNPNSLMPYLAVPVHPVQLYDAFLGFALCFGLYKIYQKGYEYWKWIIPTFFFFYPLGRFLTETLRGDGYRGTGYLFGWSTSQLISVVLFIGAIVYLVRFLKQNKPKSVIHQSLLVEET